jgi:cyclopropane fatty-acyl-phospholipid synthase-like methyltransferase
MVAAHEMVLKELDTSPPRGLTVDLGCGNGHLMRRIAARHAVPVLGIEADSSRVKGAEDILIQDLARVETLPNADTLVVSQRRFEEIPSLESWAFAHARQVLVYSYDPPMFAEVKYGR